SALADRHTAKNGRVAADARASFHGGRHDGPIGISLHRAFVGHRPRVSVVNEIDAVADEDFVFDRDASTDKAVARQFAVAADAGAFLDFDERADLCPVTDFAAVEVDEVVDDYVPAELNVRSDYAELSGHGLEAEAFSLAYQASRRCA